MATMIPLPFLRRFTAQNRRPGRGFQALRRPSTGRRLMARASWKVRREGGIPFQRKHFVEAWRGLT